MIETSSVAEGPGRFDDSGEVLPEESRSAWIGLAALVGLFVLLALSAGSAVLLIVLLIVGSVIIHELGHFLVAKWSGMKVTQFFIGFGPRIWSIKRGETEFGIKPIWVGAYVKIIGMNNLEEVPPEDEARSYRQQPFWQRFMTVFGGPLANIVLGFVLFVGYLSFVGEPDEESWNIGAVIEGTAADLAGVEPGDRLLRIGDSAISDWDDLTDAIQPNPGEKVALLVERDGKQISLDAVLGERLTADAADAVEGLAELDRVVSVDGKPVAGYADLQARLEVGVEYVMLVDRHTVSGVDARVEVDTKVISPLPVDGVTGFLGASRGGMEPRALPIYEAVPRAATTTASMVGAATTGITHIFSPSGLSSFASLVKDATQPEVEPDPDSSSTQVLSEADDGARVVSIFGIVQVGADATERSGVGAAIAIVAGLNIFLAILNLIPLLPFDGGHMSVALYEGVRSKISGKRHHADVAKLLPVAYAVVALFVTVGLAAVFLDIARPITG